MRNRELTETRMMQVSWSLHYGANSLFQVLIILSVMFKLINLILIKYIIS